MPSINISQLVIKTLCPLKPPSQSLNVGATTTYVMEPRSTAQDVPPGTIKNVSASTSYKLSSISCPPVTTAVLRPVTQGTEGYPIAWQSGTGTIPGDPFPMMYWDDPSPSPITSYTYSGPSSYSRQTFMFGLPGNLAGPPIPSNAIILGVTLSAYVNTGYGKSTYGIYNYPSACFTGFMQPTTDSAVAGSGFTGLPSLRQDQQQGTRWPTLRHGQPRRGKCR